MVKKGKAKGKKSGQDKKPKEKVIVGPAQIPEVSETHKGYYIKQIRDLEQRVTTYHKYSEDLDVANAENQIKLDRMLDDQNDIVLFIENKLTSKGEEMKELTKTSTALQETIVKEEEQFKSQLEAIQQEHREMEKNLSKENKLLQKKLESLEESEKNRHNLSSEIKQLEMELFIQESEHRDSRYLLDKQHRIEKDKLKIEMLEQVKLVANEYKKMSNAQLSENSKRTIREMVAINDKLVKMSAQTTELIEANDVLNYRVSEQKTKITILEENEKKLIRKNVCNHHTLSLLKAKCQTLEPEVMMAVVETKDHIEELLAERARLAAELNQYRNQLVNNQEMNLNCIKEKEKLKESVKEKELLRSELKKLILQSAIAIEEVIKPRDTKSCRDVDGSETYLLKREQVLETMLLLLNSANLQTQPNNNNPSSASVDNSKSGKSRESVDSLDNDDSENASNRFDNQFNGLASQYMQNIPQYRVGFLGLVPKRSSLFQEKLNSQPSHKPISSLKTESAFHQRRHCGNYSFANKSAPAKSKVSLPCLPSKVLKFAEELITNPPYKDMKLFPHEYATDKTKGGVEALKTTKSAVSDQMWLS